VTHDPGARGMGGVFFGAGMAMIAQTLGMPTWEVFAVLLLTGIGLPLAIGGRWRNW
jgi:hypothetical protein